MVLVRLFQASSRMSACRNVLSATARVTLIVTAVAVMITDVLAQPAPPTPPAAQAPRRQTPPAKAPQKPEAPKIRQVSGVTLGWIRHCAEVGTPPALACVTQQEIRDESGNFVVSLAFQEPAGGGRKRIAIGVPLGTWLPSELNLRVDQGKVFDARYGTCLNNGCFGALDPTPDLISQMRSGQTAIVTLWDAFNQPVEVSLPLESFRIATDGAPANISESEEIHKQWIASLVARAQAKQQQPLNEQQPAPADATKN